ncbi:MAG: sulfotransferase [Phycisphaerales bacterium]|nr:sulfotransferase [Phycisphaerales bacterium]
MAKKPQQPMSPQLRKQLHHASQQIKSGNATAVQSGLVLLSRKHPNIPLIFDLLTSCNNEMGRHEEAVIAGKRAIELDPKNQDTRIRYAMALQAFGQYEQALVECERALYLQPEFLQAYKTILSIHTDTANHPKCIETLKHIDEIIAKRELDPTEYMGITLNKARLSPKPLDPEPVIKELAPLAENESLPAGFRIIAYHQLGRLSDVIKEYDQAMSYWIKGNELNKPKWNPDIHSKYIDKLIQCWKGIEKVPTSTNNFDSSRLIFITGMMRSGTSMTEQMIAQLPTVTPGGEMNAITRAVFPFESVPNPLGGQVLPITRLIYNQRVVNKMAALASTLYNEVAQEGIVTDKQPHNMYMIPIISRMFPGCKIIHCARDAQDNCLSNFQQHFARSYPHTHDFYWLGRYHADYSRMMDSWRELPELEFLDLQYEETVADPETQSKRVCEFIGQPWSEDILNFHTSSRTVRTASRDQVRKPIYQSSVKRHTRYADHLAPLREGLGIDQG